MKVVVVCSEFHRDLVEKLYTGARAKLLEHSVEIIAIEWVPGTGEIPQASHWLIEKHKPDGLLACGVIIRGETTHYESLCRILEKGLIYLQRHYSIPVIFSVLMVENRLQAENRLGGLKGHRGEEGALALMKMLKLKDQIKSI